MPRPWLIGILMSQFHPVVLVPSIASMRDVTEFQLPDLLLVCRGRQDVDHAENT